MTREQVELFPILTDESKSSIPLLEWSGLSQQLQMFANVLRM
jgi:hypothetical protein